jgi:hypothetical protein
VLRTINVSLIEQFTFLPVLQRKKKVAVVVLIHLNCMYANFQRTSGCRQSIRYHCSAVTINVTGNLKVAVSILVSWLLFGYPMTALNVLGCTITVGRCTIYGYVTHLVKVCLLIFLWGSCQRFFFLVSQRWCPYCNPCCLAAFALPVDALQSCGSASGVVGAPFIYL